MVNYYIIFVIIVVLTRVRTQTLTWLVAVTEPTLTIQHTLADSQTTRMAPAPTLTFANTQSPDDVISGESTAALRTGRRRFSPH